MRTRTSVALVGLALLVACGGQPPSEAEVACVTVYPPTTSATFPNGDIKPWDPKYDPDPHVHCFDGEGRLLSVDGKPVKG
jgi:hypothetical protein